MKSEASSGKYRAYLKAEYERRLAANPRYSMRAYARDLKVAPSVISEILNGRHGLSRKSAETIAARLPISERERAYFCDLADAAHARTSVVRQAAARRVAAYE